MKRIFMSSIFLSFVILFIVCSSAAPGMAEEGSPFKDDPEAHALYDRMFEVFKTENTIYLESDYSWGGDGQTLAHVKYRIWLKKDDFARLEIRSFESDPACDVILDGEQFWIYWPEGGPYMSWMDPEEYEKTKMKMYQVKEAPPGYHSIAHTFADTWVGTSMTIFQFSSFHGYTDAMMDYLDGVRGLGTESIDGSECDVIEVSFMDGQRVRKYWLSRENHLPVKLEQAIHAGSEIFHREIWSNVRIGEPMDDGLFDWVPGEDWVRVKQPEIEDCLLEVGVQAPIFEADLMDGGRFSLEVERGNVIWLVFWRVGCPPCRIEMPHLEAMHTKYGDRGLRVIGFNCADEKGIAREFLEEYKATYPTVMDTSEEAKAVFFEKYQTIRGMSAVPLNYVIDREGRIAKAWYGFDEKAHGDEKWLLDILDGKGPGTADGQPASTSKTYSEAELKVVIDYLLAFVEESDVIFIRNGKQHSSKDAAKHIKRKYRHFRKEIETPEDFIRLSATRSERSGKPYMVKLPEGEEIPCSKWLVGELVKYEEKIR